LAQLASERIDCSGFITHRCALSSIDQEMSKMRSGEVVHLIAKP